MKPKFRIGQRVKLKSYETIKSEIGSYVDRTGLVSDMPFGQYVVIEHIEISERNKEVKYFNYYLKNHRYLYHEKWFEDTLSKKINKILKI